MKKIFLVTLLISTFVFAKDNKDMVASEIKVGVKGMVCAFCAQGIEKSFKNQPEVAKIEVSLENKYVKLKFKDGQTLSKEKITELLKEAGYESNFQE